MDLTDIETLEKRLAYRFSNREFVVEALSHSSYVNEQNRPELRDNERMEFLGDAVLNLVVGHLLMQRFPDLNEGELSRFRANLVNESQVARLAQAFDLGAHLLLGKGEERSGGRDKQSILADAAEALIAAVYLDAGYDAAFRFIQTHLSEALDAIFAPAANYDFKSRLQETAQASIGEIPVYRVIGESGPDHDKTFHVAVDLSDIHTEGVGKSKKMAEQNAAKHALAALGTNGGEDTDEGH
ncbi:Ribonuclease III (EC [Olavius algarvensis associated proteobacterium Delta 3]|nr:Ribonuclease III (EC [Olavius algarvensis associated proteobacterium Delta 3]CAB5146679.1 Ribonuclease III (EC [Olavius algarvensis associated proteobacterium Delta 3]